VQISAFLATLRSVFFSVRHKKKEREKKKRKGEGGKRPLRGPEFVAVLVVSPSLTSPTEAGRRGGRKRGKKGCRDERADLGARGRKKKEEKERDRSESQFKYYFGAYSPPRKAARLGGEGGEREKKKKEKC